VEDITAHFIEGLSKLQEVADSATPDEAAKSIDHAGLQNFWREWPEISSWAGALWRLLNKELADPATPIEDPELDESGGGG
jgi:hypothetical protein